MTTTPPLDTSAAKAANTALVVLGMHRSGTSATGGVINLLGVDFGKRLYQAQVNVNEKGFWEHQAIVDLHDELLLELASRWDDPRLLPEGWHTQPSLQQFRARLAKIIAADFAGSPLWGLKDPRMCRLLPLWKDLFASLGIKPLYLIVLRDPLEVAASLQKRDGLSISKSMLLWWQHHVLAERETRGCPRVFISFPELLTQPQAVLERIGSCLGLEWPTPLERAMPAVTGFLAPNLRHHLEPPLSGGTPAETGAEEAYRAYLSAMANPGIAQIDAEQDFTAYYQTLEPLLLEHLASLAAENRAAQQTLARYYDCFAVKAAKRLCMLEKAFFSLFTARH